MTPQATTRNNFLEHLMEVSSDDEVDVAEDGVQCLRDLIQDCQDKYSQHQLVHYPSASTPDTTTVEAEKSTVHASGAPSLLMPQEAWVDLWPVLEVSLKPETP
jgi:hypothetical protein